MILVLLVGGFLTEAKMVFGQRLSVLRQILAMVHYTTERIKALTSPAGLAMSTPFGILLRVITPLTMGSRVLVTVASIGVRLLATHI